MASKEEWSNDHISSVNGPLLKKLSYIQQPSTNVNDRNQSVSSLFFPLLMKTFSMLTTVVCIVKRSMTWIHCHFWQIIGQATQIDSFRWETKWRAGQVAKHDDGWLKTFGNFMCIQWNTCRASFTEMSKVKFSEWLETSELLILFRYFSHIFLVLSFVFLCFVVFFLIFHRKCSFVPLYLHSKWNPSQYLLISFSSTLIKKKRNE